MPAVFHTVLCLLHASQNKSGNHGFLGCSRNLFNYFLNFLGMNFLTAGLLTFAPNRLHIITHVLQKQHQLLHTIPVRHTMYTIHKGNLQPVEMLCHRLVGRQHEILYQIGSHIPFIGLDLQRISLFIQQNLAFRQIKINGTSFLPLLSKNGGKLLHQNKHRHQTGIPCIVRIRLHNTLLLQNILHRSITHPLIHTNHGFPDIIIYDLSLKIYTHQTA